MLPFVLSVCWASGVINCTLVWGEKLPPKDEAIVVLNEKSNELALQKRSFRRLIQQFISQTFKATK